MNIHEENLKLLEILDKADLTELQIKHITRLNAFIQSKKDKTGYTNMVMAGHMNRVLGSIVKELEM